MTNENDNIVSLEPMIKAKEHFKRLLNLLLDLEDTLIDIKNDIQNGLLTLDALDFMKRMDGEEIREKLREINK